MIAVGVISVYLAPNLGSWERSHGPVVFSNQINEEN